MKISSASKKVLASALSAAMVVAFAPAAAFASIDNGTQVTVSFDANGGAAAPAGLDDMKVTVTDGNLTLTDAQAGGARYKKGESAFDFWFYDANNDGKYTTGDNSGDLKVTGNALNVSGESISGTDITLKASYKEISATASATFNTAASGYDKDGRSDVTVTAQNLENGSYKAVAVVNGKTYYSNAVTVSDSADTSFTVSVENSKFAAGDIAAYVVKNADNAKVEGTDATTSVYTLTYKAGDFGAFSDGSASKTYLAAKGTAVSALNDVASPVPGSGYNLESEVYALEDGTTATSVTKDLTFVAQYVVAKVSALNFTEDSGLTYEAKNLPVYDANNNKNLESYKVTVLAGSTELTSVKVAAGADSEFSGSISNKLEFGKDYTTATTTTAKAAAGTYTVKVEAQYADGTTGNTAVAVSKSVTVDAIALDANGGTAPKTATNTPALIQAGAALSSVSFNVDYAYGYTNADDTLAFAGWSVDGSKKADASKVIAPADGSAVTLKALWTASKAAKPTLASATETSTDKYTLTFASATSGAKLTYNVNGVTGTVPATGLVNVAADAKVTVTASADKLTNQSEDFYGYKHADTVTPLKSFDDFAAAVLAHVTADAQTPKPVYYNSVEAVKAAKDAGDAAIKAQGFATKKQWAKLVAEQQEAVLKAAVSYGASQVEALKTPVKSADGKTYSYLSDDFAKQCAKAFDAVVEEFEVDNADALGIKTDETPGSHDASYYIEDVNDIVEFAQELAATNKVDAADVEAAQAVTAQLQAAKDATAAKAALEAYNALTDVQKGFVATADVTAAQQIVADQEKKDAEQKLIDAQDEAAVAGITGKTVKAKSKKKVTAKLKGATSKSGNVVTFSKKSGNAKVKIAKGGKITVKKGLKKGKKYTVKVTASCGNATKVVKVVVKVVK